MKSHLIYCLEITRSKAKCDMVTIAFETFWLQHSIVSIYLQPFLSQKRVVSPPEMTLVVNVKISTGVCTFIYRHHHLTLGLAFLMEHITSSQVQQQPFKPSGFITGVYDPSNPLRALNCLSSDPCNVNITVFSTTGCYS